MTTKRAAPLVCPRTAAAWLAVPAMLATSPAWAGPPQLSGPDTAWLMTATILVLMMTLPGLALFYSGLVRAKNATAMLTQVFTVFCAVAVVWFAVGYSVAFTGSTWASYFGGLGKAFLAGVKPSSIAATHTNGVGVPEYVMFAFQMTFACIAPALIVGAFAERMRFAAAVLFAVLWSLFVYVPIAHMTWFKPGPDAIADAAQAVLTAPAGPMRRQAEGALLELMGQMGLFAQWGTIDFAGGLVIHAAAGIAGLIGALAVGRRAGYGQQSMAPHNLAMMLIGGALLWIGWVGLTAGSALRADGTAALAMINTLLAAAAGAIAWLATEIGHGQKPSLIGAVSGMLAGLVAISAAAGHAAPGGAFALGVAAGPLCYSACTHLKRRYQYDDALDVFGIHCVGGVLGVLATAVLASPELGGTGLPDYMARPGQAVVAAYDIAAQMRAQLSALALTLVWSAYISHRLFRLVDGLVGLRPSEEEEHRGLDLVDHDERVTN